MKKGWRLGIVLCSSLGCTEGPGGRGTDDPTGYATSGGSGGGSAETGIGDETGTSSDAGSEDDDGPLPDAPQPVFECEPTSADSPKLAAQLSFAPAQPHPGDTLTVIARATNGTSRQDAPEMELSVESADGVLVHPTQTIEGGQALYYYAIPELPPGDICVLGLIEGQPEVSGRVRVTPRPAGPPATNGVFTVVSNHQWTCDEQPGWGNEVHVRVEDQHGQGLPGMTVDLELADTTDLESIYNDAENIPAQLVTDDNGNAMFFNAWPISDNGLLVFEISVAGHASDIATEITTGWWEDDLMGCKYCGQGTINVWGHWSYGVTFRLDPDRSEACVVANDHAGMEACGSPRHIHHHPQHVACWSAQ